MTFRRAATTPAPGGATVGVLSPPEPIKTEHTPESGRRVVRDRSPGEHDGTHPVKVLGVRSLLTVSGTREQRIGAIARLQRGRVARRQLLAAGITPASIGRMLRRGSLVREHAGVYAVAHTAPTPLARETATLLACGERAFLSHRSAAALWGLLDGDKGPVDVTVVGARTGRHPTGIAIHRTGRLVARDVRIHQGLPVTSPARTLLDIAAQTPGADYERALDEALVVLKIVRLDELQDAAKRAAGRREGPILATLLNRRGPATITESMAERRFLKLMRDAGLPQPKTRVRMAGFKVTSSGQSSGWRSKSTATGTTRVDMPSTATAARTRP